MNCNSVKSLKLLHLYCCSVYKCAGTTKDYSEIGSLGIGLFELLVRALNADWVTVMVYQTIYHGYDKTFIFTALITLVTSLY
jgi:hypothetical protein